MVAEPIFAGGAIVTAPPEIVTDEDETPIVENAVPPALFALNVMVPVPLGGGVLNVRVTLVLIATLVAALAGLIELNVKSNVVKL